MLVVLNQDVSFRMSHTDKMENNVKSSRVAQGTTDKSLLANNWSGVGVV